MLTETGLASISTFKAASASALMTELRRYSREFRRRHGTRRGPTAAYWRYDPMDHGLRRWEYPFLMERVLALCEAGQGGSENAIRMLDAGAGMTCIPYFLAERLPHATVDACDMDPMLPAMYEAINRRATRPVAFAEADLRALPYDDGAFDLVFCMSVLEHTDEYEKIIREFRRVLRPGGRLIVTFDISLDGRTDIDPPRAERLTASLAAHFTGVPTESLLPLAERLSSPDRLTTGYLREHAPRLLPWHMTPRIFLGALRRLRMPQTPFFSITVCGLDLTRPMEV